MEIGSELVEDEIQRSELAISCGRAKVGKATKAGGKEREGLRCKGRKG